MSSDSNELTTSDLAVLDTLHGAPQAVSQRELARRTGLSVGLINAIIKKLVHTGYVKTSQLNRRQLDYLLTPQGFTHAALRSYRYIADTVRRYQSMQSKLKQLLDRLVGEGLKEFYLHGEGELSELVAVFFAEKGNGPLKRGLPSGKGDGAVVLNAQPDPLDHPNFRVVNLIHELGDGRGTHGTGSGEQGSATEQAANIREWTA